MTPSSAHLQGSEVNRMMKMNMCPVETIGESCLLLGKDRERKWWHTGRRGLSQESHLESVLENR